MSEVRPQLRYTKDHEWIRREPDGTAVVGITDHAQHELGELVYVELPEGGQAVKAGDTLAVVESTKAASDVYAPLTGEVLEANGALAGEPALVNSDPYGDGWLVKVQVEDPDELDGLMSAEQYAEFLEDADG